MKLSIFLFFLAGFAPAFAGLPEITSTSPDQAWTITTRWINGSTFQEGYDWDLKKVKTGKIYFHEDVSKDAALPHRFGVLWSPDSRYVALNIYYGRRLYDVSVIHLADEPEVAQVPLTFPGISPEKAFLNAEDLALFSGYFTLRGADRWINNSDLSLDLEFSAYLVDKKAAKKFSLVSEWDQIIHFDGKAGKIIESHCGSYDKFPNPN